MRNFDSLKDGVYMDVAGALWRCLGRSGMGYTWLFVSMSTGLTIEMDRDFIMSSMVKVAWVH